MDDLRARTSDAAAAVRETAGKLNEVRARRTAPLILELDLTEPLLTAPPADPLAAFVRRRRTALKTVLDGLRKAAADDRVRTLVAKVGLPRMGLAQAQELRDAVAAFRASGKRTVAWAETFGEWGPGTVAYYLAGAFDEIWLQPIGDVNLTGITVGATFLREALDKLDVQPQYGQRYEYKNAADMLTRSSFSDAHREALQAVAASAFDRILADLAADRGLSDQEIRDLVDRAPIDAEEAVAAKLVDRLGYRDEVYAEVRNRAGEDARLEYLTRYQHPLVQLPKRRPDHTFALIWGIGPIVQGKGAGRPLVGHRMGSDTVSSAFRAAVRDPRVEAIVFRVDSPGGSAVASDAIWREVGLARQAGKPVVVSMGDVAGSGGYYVAMAADAIVAEPSTITGSIGVLGGKLVSDGLLNRIGLTYDSVALGAMARLYSGRTPYGEAERAALERWLDRIYETFVGKVADGRGMNRDEVHAVAKGRIWTGSDARERGLVDALGGLDKAVDLARSKARIPTAVDVSLVSYPKIPPIARVIPPRSSESPGAADVTHAVFRNAWGDFTYIAASLGLPAAGPLSMPGFSLV
jgi:protease-4